MLKRMLGIQTSECRIVSVFHRTHLVFFAPRHVEADAMTNFIYRQSFKLSHYPSKVLVPKTDISDYDRAESLLSQVKGGKMIMAEGFTRFKRSVLDKVANGEFFIAMLQVSHALPCQRVLSALSCSHVPLVLLPFYFYAVFAMLNTGAACVCVCVCVFVLGSSVPFLEHVGIRQGQIQQTRRHHC